MPDKPTTNSAYNRCSWMWHAERCAYVARVFHGDPTSGKGLCLGHFRNNSGVEAVEIFRTSLQDVPLDFDYSTEHLVKLSEDAYIRRTMSKAEREREPREPGEEG